MATTKVCFAYLSSGSCGKGKNCGYSHVKQCRDFASGSCQRGSSCRFAHVAVRSNGKRQKQQQQQQSKAVVSLKGGKLKGGKGSQRSVEIDFDDGKGRREKLVVEKVASKRLVFAAAVDVSSSMAGRPLDVAIQSLAQVYGEVMRDDDLYGLLTFQSDVRTLHRPMCKSKVSFEKDREHMRANAGGLTALYDGMRNAIEGVRYACQAKVVSRRSDVVEVLIITDGMENASRSTTLEQICQLVAKPGISNFNLVVVGVGAVDQVSLKRICKPRHARFLYAKDLPALERTLRSVVDRIRITLDVRDDQKSQRLQAKWEGASRDAGGALEGMRGQSQLLQTLARGALFKGSSSGAAAAALRFR